jgi:hypothetical protein
VIGFLGGVRDVAGARGFIPMAPDTIVAVDLASGTVLWRRSGIGRPLAATATRLVTVAARAPAFVLRLIDAASGENSGELDPPGWPHWAEEGVGPEVLQVTASEAPNGVRLGWHLQRAYHGGASPSAAVLADLQGDAAGHLLLDVESVRGTVVSGDVAAPWSRGLEEAVVGEAVVSGPDVLACDRVGARVFTLKAIARGHTRTVVLEARDAASGAHWDTSIGELAARPGPLRK